MSEIFERLRRQRSLWVSALDCASWVIGFVATGAVLYVLGHHSREFMLQGLFVGLIGSGFFLVFGRATHLHHGRAKSGSFDEVVLATAAAVSSWLLTATINLAQIARAELMVLGFFPALACLVGWRAVFRLLLESSPASPAASGTRVLIVGAGNAGGQLVNEMLADREGTWRPVALLDDDPLKRHRRIRGLSVVGRTEDLVKVADQFEARVAVIAIPSADADTVRALTAPAAEAGIDVKVLPSTNELLVPSKVRIQDIRDIDVTDLLGRHQVETDVASIAGYLTGKRVLVTGAGGSIGAELCRQIAAFGPEELIMLDRDESALHAVQLSIYGKAMLDDDDTILADIRDAAAVDGIFLDRQPQVVFHAAALKHLPMLEKAPGEAVKTNIWGTLTVLEAAARHGVERFVNISTDKAASPISVLGYSKRIAEGLTASVAGDSDGTFLSVRFGNVLGSRGSVLTAFAAQIAKGGPVTVTDPGAMRYFMTIREAVQLVIQAAAIGSDGEVLVLDMGKPVSIDAVARQLIEMSGRRMDVVYTGLRAGEKLAEDLWGPGESDERRAHPLIAHATVPRVEPIAVRGIDSRANRSAIIDELVQVCESMSARVGSVEPS